MPRLLASKMKLRLCQKELGFLLSIHGSQDDKFLGPCIYITLQCWSLAPWSLRQSRCPYQRMCPFSCSPSQTLEDFPLPLFVSFFSPLFHHLICWFVPLANQCAITWWHKSALVYWSWKSCHCHSITDFGLQVSLPSDNSLDTPVAPQLWSLGQQ